MWGQMRVVKKSNLEKLWDCIFENLYWFHKQYDSDYRDSVQDWDFVSFNLRLFEHLDSLIENFLVKVAKKFKVNLDANRDEVMVKAKFLESMGDRLVLNLLKSLSKEIKSAFKSEKDDRFEGKSSKSYKVFVESCTEVGEVIRLISRLGIDIKI